MAASTRRGTRLHGQVDVIADGGVGVHGIDDGAHEIARMAGGVAHAAHAGDFGDARQQRGEVPSGGRGIAVAVDVLAEQLDFGVALFGEPARFRHDALAGAAALRSAGEGHHAIGAGFVAAFDDGEVGAVRVVAARERRVEGFGVVEAQAGDAAVAAFELDQHFAEVGVAGRPGDQRNVRRAVEDLFALLLGDAAQHAEDLVLHPLALEVLQAVEDLLFGLIADAARVVEYESRVVRRLHLRVALGQQGADDFFGVVGIHLAAECFDVKGFPRHCSSIVQVNDLSVSEQPACWRDPPCAQCKLK